MVGVGVVLAVDDDAERGLELGLGVGDLLFRPSTNTAIRPEQDDVVTTPSRRFIESISSRMGASRVPFGEESVYVDSGCERDARMVDFWVVKERGIGGVDLDTDFDFGFCAGGRGVLSIIGAYDKDGDEEMDVSC